MTVVPALLPVFAIILVGAVCRRWNFPGEGFWSPAEKLTYYLLFPSLLFHRLATADLPVDALGGLLSAALLLLLIASVLMLPLRPLLSLSGPAFSSFYQGGIRFNTYIGMALALALFGNDGVVAAALLLAILIPAVNVLCVLALTHYGEGKKAGVKGVVLGLVKNPLIIACLAGFAFNGQPIPGSMMNTLELLGTAALPIGLLAVGASLRRTAITDRPGALLANSLVKLLALPVMAAVVAHVIGLQGTVRDVFVLFCLLPTAPSAYILARQMGGDAELMAATLTVQTMLAFISLPLVIFWLF